MNHQDMTPEDMINHCMELEARLAHSDTQSYNDHIDMLVNTGQIDTGEQ